jgi:hypothetical protein
MRGLQDADPALSRCKAAGTATLPRGGHSGLRALGSCVSPQCAHLARLADHRSTTHL